MTAPLLNVNFTPALQLAIAIVLLALFLRYELLSRSNYGEVTCVAVTHRSTGVPH